MGLKYIIQLATGLRVQKLVYAIRNDLAVRNLLPLTLIISTY